jgi:hypothetical protein
VKKAKKKFFRVTNRKSQPYVVDNIDDALIRRGFYPKWRGNQMPQNISGPVAAAWFDLLKERYGVSFAATAKMCGIPPQHVTDLRSERRRITYSHTHDLLVKSRGKPWYDLISFYVNDYYEFASKIKRDQDIEKYELPPFPASTGSTASSSASSAPAALLKLPVLTAPFRGNPELSPTFDDDQYVELTGEAADLADGAVNAYILRVHCDDRVKAPREYDDNARRLRIGDKVLVLQDAESEAEIQIVAVDDQDTGRLARRVKVIRELGIPRENDVDRKLADGEWMALDSGAHIPDARPVAYVAGIVWARL